MTPEEAAQEVWPDRPDLRGWLGLLEQRGELRRLRSEIDPDQEVTAVLEEVDGRSAVLFTAVRGAQFPLLGNTVATREDFSALLGCPSEDVVRRLGDAVAAPVSCVEVALADAPVAAVPESGPDLLHDLPLPVQHEHDAGRYLTSALLTVRDPRTGLTNLSINRLQVAGPRELRVLLLPGRLRSIFDESERRGEDLPIAICIGVDPALVLASQSPADSEIDDLEVASALHPRPLEVVTLPGHNFPVPARAEMVLLGTVMAGQRAQEGPFGEYPRTYGPAGPAPVIQLTSRWRRPDPIGQTILSGGREHFWVGGLPREARLLRALEGAGIRPYAVRLTEAGSCRLHAVVSLAAPSPGTVHHAAMAVFAALAPVKLVVVVDEDVDVFDDEAVGWAVATRFQADRDLLVIPRSRGGGLDPSAEGGPTAKLVVDATVPAGKRQHHARMRSTITGSPRLAELMRQLEPGRG
ncbi:MAG TPA: UbiD family decarboxylase [Intrasporangium sp.]|uniref:UbiD family decarboxylase n=1 Tax=Intrasporangium sp. TaxID=1925024 RepID=UPI002D769F6B|nr:UbiD family decarboxylase [Intrasporangium sp.]HET7397394.1 UbiD family decarboxylase [Intrasporangium sp.]